MKERFSISIDEDIIKSISSLSTKTGLSKSYIVNKFILNGLKRDYRLSISERYFFAKKLILDNINILFSAIGYECRNNNIVSNIITLFSLPKSSFSTEKEYALMRVSILEIVDSIQVHDTKLHEDLINSLKEINLKINKSSEISEELYNSEMSEDTVETSLPIIVKPRPITVETSIESSQGVPFGNFLKSSETSRLPAGVPDINNTTISVTGKSVTEKRYK